MSTKAVTYASSRASTRASTKPVGRPRGTNSADTRRDILDAARLCFAENGYAATSNKDIALRASLTPGSIYHYFDSKSDLFLSVHRELQERSVANCREAVRDKATLLEAAEALLDQLSKTQADTPSYTRFNAVVRTEAARNPDIQVAREDKAWRDLYADLAKLGVATGEVDAKDERAVRGLFATLILGTTHHAAEAKPESHREALRAVKLLLQGTLLKNKRDSNLKN
jgi:AcrR family transcriptional regulator